MQMQGYPMQPMQQGYPMQPMQGLPVQQNKMGESGPEPLLPAGAQRSDGPDIFQNLQKVLVKQEFALVELCGIEVKNRYRISPENNPGNTFLYAKEQSECCERVCCSPCRALTMHVHAGNDALGPVQLEMQKTTHCPMFKVMIGGALIGTVEDPPWPLFGCRANAIIRDAAGQALFTVGPTCLCNCGMVCACCADMDVMVFNEANAQVATITRKALNLAECCGKFNRFVVDFGSLTDPKHRALIFAAAMLFDLQYWEQKN